MKSTIKEKLLYDSSLSEFFSLVRKERKGQKEEGIDSRLGDADRVRLRESVNSPLEKANSYFRQRRYQTHARPSFSAGVQTMRARICSAFSCDMFARVV